jgi:hypothetical protein
MCDTVDVFAGNYTIIDWEIHELWLNGLSTNEAISYLRDGVVKDFGPNIISQEILASDVNDHYRLFDMLENAIITLNYSAASNETPFNFSAQFQFIDECTKERLIESYYDLDGLLCREIVGKKLSSRLRKDLDEICEKISTTDKSVVACGAGAVGLRLKSARRQFDNVKRVFKTIEEMGGDYVTNIKNQFGLSQTLAERYATLVFASSFRFEMAKRKLNYLTFDDVIVPISLVLIENWIDCGPSLDNTSTVANSTIYGEGVDPEKLNEPPTLDKDFLTSLRDLKALQERDKEHRNVVCSRLQYFLPSHPPISTASSNQLSNTAWPSFGLFDDGDDSGKSSKQSSRKSSAAMTAQNELINDKTLSCVIPRNQSGVSAGSHSQTSTVITSESGSQCLSSQKAFAELEGNFKIITRGIVSLATGLSHNKEVKDFFVHLVEKVVEPFRSLKVTKNDVDIFLRQYTLAITEAGYGISVDGGSRQLATLLMENEVRLIFARFMNSLIPAVMAAYPT